MNYDVGETQTRGWPQDKNCIKTKNVAFAKLKLNRSVEEKKNTLYVLCWLKNEY